MSDCSDRTLPIDLALDQCADQVAGGGILLSEALSKIGSHGFCFAAFLLAVPFVQPIPVGPLAMVGAFGFMALGWQMVRGHEVPTLPKSVGGLRIQGRLWLGVIAFARKLLKTCRIFTRQRFEPLIEGVRGRQLVGALIFTGGALLAIPVASLPLNNFFPALMIIFACLAWIERDGMMLLVSLVWGVATLVYFALVAVALLFFGKQVWAWMTPFAA